MHVWIVTHCWKVSAWNWQPWGIIVDAISFFLHRLLRTNFPFSPFPWAFPITASPQAISTLFQIIAKPFNSTTLRHCETFFVFSIFTAAEIEGMISGCSFERMVTRLSNSTFSQFMQIGGIVASLLSRCQDLASSLQVASWSSNQRGKLQLKFLNLPIYAWWYWTDLKI